MSTNRQENSLTAGSNPLNVAGTGQHKEQIMISRPLSPCDRAATRLSRNMQRNIVWIFQVIGLSFSLGCKGLSSFSVVPVICLLLFFPATGHSQQEALLITGSVTQIVENLKNTIHGAISALDTTYSNSAFRTRQHLQILLNQLEAVAENITESTFSDLSSMAQKFFADVAVQIESLKTFEKITFSDTEKITRSMSSAIRNLPFADNVPIVFHYDPLYVEGKKDEGPTEITLTISGGLLSSGEPSLTLGETECRRDGKIHTSLTFVCVVAALMVDDSLDKIIGELRLYAEKSFWDRVFFRKDKSYSYDIYVSVMPRSLGTINVKIIYEVTTPKLKKRQQEFSAWNSHCAGARQKLFEFNVSHGWIIDVDSIKVLRCGGGRKSRCNGLQHISEASFAYECHLENYGKCIWLGKDGRGHCYGKVEWFEVAVDTNKKQETLPLVNVYWGEDRLIPLRAGTESVEIFLAKADGERRIFTKTDASDPWVSVTVDLANGRVIIRPKDLDVAMK